MKSVINQYRCFSSKTMVLACAGGLVLLSLMSEPKSTVQAVDNHSSREASYPAKSDPEIPGVTSVARPVPNLSQASPTKLVNWKLEKTTGDKPSARGGGKMVAVGNKLVVLYGFFECFEKTKCEHLYFDEIYTFDVTTNKWEKKHPTSSSGSLPAKRVFFGASTYKKRHAVVIYGGSEYNVSVTSVKMYDDMWEYDPEADTMVERKYTNEGPGKRLGPEIVIQDDMLFLFGGYDPKFKAHNDLWSFDLLTNTWKQLKKDDEPKSPSKRYIFRFELSGSNEDLYIFGGNYREAKTIQRNDLWKYNIPTNTFTEIVSEKNTNISGRTHGAAAVFGDMFIIALGDIPSGGCFTDQASEHQNPTNEVWSIRVGGSHPSSQWQTVKIGFSPPPLKRVIYATVGGRLYVTQGFNYECSNPGRAGPVYNTETYSLQLRQIH
jgi:N-acetylneuraminic acid mutarotase